MLEDPTRRLRVTEEGPILFKGPSIGKQLLWIGGGLVALMILIAIFVRSPFTKEQNEMLSEGIDHGGMPCSIKYTTRRVMTRVFPLPAPAMMSNGPSTCVAASRCSGVRSSSNDDASIKRRLRW